MESAPCTLFLGIKPRHNVIDHESNTSGRPQADRDRREQDRGGSEARRKCRPLETGAQSVSSGNDGPSDFAQPQSVAVRTSRRSGDGDLITITQVAQGATVAKMDRVESIEGELQEAGLHTLPGADEQALAAFERIRSRRGPDAHRIREAASQDSPDSREDTGDEGAAAK